MKNEGALRSVFSGMTESIGPMCCHIFLPLGRVPFPVGPLPGYRTRRKERALPIVRDEFRTGYSLIGFARQQSRRVGPGNFAPSLSQIQT
jgi:hypothetical protein